ncbi:MAG: hypothetical protein IPM42_00830 [Saprospiraceae bacterium]|nr:hypothetical protein [Saprospiraceae bacterium]
MRLREIEDFHWFHPLLRKHQMEIIGILTDQLHIFRSIAGIIEEKLRQNSLHKITDVCSGNGNPAIYIHTRLQNQLSATILTDLYPQETPFHTNIHYQKSPINILEIDPDKDRIYTMYNAFHHFTDSEKKVIVKNFCDQKSHFVFVEILRPDLFSLVQVIFASTIGVLVFTPFIRPFDWKRLFLTYILPVNIFTVLTDGIISVFKSSTKKSYQDLLKEYSDSDKIEITEIFSFPTFLVVIQSK